MTATLAIHPRSKGRGMTMPDIGARLSVVETKLENIKELSIERNETMRRTNNDLQRANEKRDATLERIERTLDELTSHHNVIKTGLYSLGVVVLAAIGWVVQFISGTHRP